MFFLSNVLLALVKLKNFFKTPDSLSISSSALPFFSRCIYTFKRAVLLGARRKFTFLLSIKLYFSV